MKVKPFSFNKKMLRLLPLVLGGILFLCFASKGWAASCAPVSATFTILVDDAAAIYLNGNLILDTGTDCHMNWKNAITTTVPVGDLNLAGNNTLAIYAADACGGASWMSYEMTIYCADGTKQCLDSNGACTKAELAAGVTFPTSGPATQ